MAAIQRSAATLRISGSHLDPAEITRLLGCAPDSAQRRGQEIPGRSGGSARTAHTGMWRLSASVREPGDLNGQISELLSKVTDDLTIWASIADKYHIDLFCGLSMQGRNEGLSIAPPSLAALGLRRIELGLDIYGGDDQARKSDPT